MANNSITAANMVGDANMASNSAETASNSAENVSNTTANTSGSDGGGMPAWASDFCNHYGDVLLYTALAFLLFALLLAVGNGIVALRKEWNSDGIGVRGEGIGDPAKFMDSLKALIEALAKAPAWFAMFLGGALLLWIAKDFAEGACLPESSSKTAGSNDGDRAGTRNPRPSAQPTKAGGGQAPGTTPQRPKAPSDG